MTAFVILAAGPGTRMGRAGEHLHKALLPLDGRAIISHQISLAPAGARIIVCTGYRAGQVADYLHLAHPGRDITLVPVPGWDQPGGGPGASLLAARDRIGSADLIVTSCDTLWTGCPSLWTAGMSWAAVAPVPDGTPPERWCRLVCIPAGYIDAVCDRTSGPLVAGLAYTGLAMVLRRDLPAFWAGVAGAPLTAGERQIAGGLAALARERRLAWCRAGWTDTGDEAAYARTVTARSGYDWAKPGEATWVLPDEGRVVKFRADQSALNRCAARHETIAAAVPRLAGTRPHMLACDYVPGVPAYDLTDTDPYLLPRVLDWARAELWHPAAAVDLEGACDRFYRAKTQHRVAALRPGLRDRAERAIAGVDWAGLARGCVPVTFHGDFNLGNIIATPGGGFTAIDWRDDFAGETGWGDQRYDLAKLAAGLMIHWGNARRGDFGTWPGGWAHLGAMAAHLGGEVPRDVQMIAALSLLNSAPLHHPPLDRILVDCGVVLLEVPA